MAAFDQRALRDAFGAFMTGVTVVTALADDGSPVGFTANSYTSVSLEPPLLLVCPAKSLSSFAVFNRCRRFAINILAEDQRDVSNIFARSKGDRFAQVPWQADKHGCPIIEGAAATFSCATHQRVDAGDHIILVGHVTGFDASGAAGLGYAKSGYFSLAMERKAAELPRHSRTTIVGAIIEHDGKLLMEETDAGLRPPQTTVSGDDGPLAAVEALVQAEGLKVDFGPVYSIFEDRGSGKVFTYWRGKASNAQTGALGRYRSVETLGAERFVSDAVSIMIQRFLLERQSDAFGLYVGDEADGDLHHLGDRPSR